jgi:hypothetical protein
MSPIDFRHTAITPEARLAQRFADLERRASQQERSSFNRSVATARITTASTLTITNNVERVVNNFSQVEWDVGDLFSASAPDRLTVAEPDIYLVKGWGKFSGLADRAGLRG